MFVVCYSKDSGHLVIMAEELKKAKGTRKGVLTKCILKLQPLVAEDAAYDEVSVTLDRTKKLFKEFDKAHDACRIPASQLINNTWTADFKMEELFYLQSQV